MTGELELYKVTKTNLDDVSPSFCLAKWLQVTLHLQNGRNHSCHHPGTHPISLEEIEINPAALHNTTYKRAQQDMMLAGARPPECQYCWNVEDLPGDHVSDRLIKSSESVWAGPERIEPLLDKIESGEDINPTYVEISFSNACNFKCAYCSPVHSSLWVSEINKHGPYRLSTRLHQDLDYYKQVGDMPIHHTEHNPYVEAFWKWWPELSKTLQIFRITGGEPLIEPNTFKTIEMISNDPKPEMEFSINSNLGQPDSIIDTYIASIRELIDNKKIRRHVLFTSVDGSGAAAEYGRHGLDYDQWLKNVKKILTELPSVKIVVMCTANIFSITSFEQLLRDIYEIKMKYRNDQRVAAITIDTSILRWPHHQCAAILPGEYSSFMDSAFEFIKSKEECTPDNPPWEGFFQFEIEKVARFIEFIRNPPNANEGLSVTSAMRDFYLFVNEHDRRRGTNFLKTFPELEDFYRECERLNNNIIQVG